ncbi:MAG: putative peptidoglycan lipid II flippase MurJ [Microgenomates group bacterium GW2011_GWA2_47_8]|nr:MAG: putative peptidoglycan lipid II flippase MurJ [Microgenomates group bacterium GW2011_GWA2_47_8]
MVLAFMVFASRVLGLVRDRFLAARFAPDELGVYFAAFRIPNLLFELLVMGALTSAFIPVFTRFIAEDKKEEAWRMAATLINVSFIILVVLSLPILLWTDGVSRLLAPGFTDTQIHEMARFTRFMVIFQVVPLLVGNFFTGILQSYQYFFIPALAPVVYNIGIIIGIVLFSSSFGLFAPVIGVGIGALLFMGIQIPLVVRLGYRHRFMFDLRGRGVADVGKLMAPRTLGLAVSQIDTTVDLVLASILGARMVTIFNFAQHLQQLPIGLFGATVAQAALPALSLSHAKDDLTQFKHTVVSSLHQIFFFVMPASVLFIVLRVPIVRLVFGASRFDWEATVLTGMTLSAFSLSLSAQATAQVLARAFYALYNSKIPVAIAVASIAVNTILSVVFIQFFHLAVWSLGLSASIASIVNAGLLLVLLDRRVGGFSRRELLGPPCKMLIASVITGIMLYIPLKILDQLVFDTTRTWGLILLTGVSGTMGLVTYGFLTWVMGVGEVRSFLVMVWKVRKVRTMILEPAHEVINGGIQDKIS